MTVAQPLTQQPATLNPHSRDEMLKATQFVVEATSAETHMLWEHYCTQSMYWHCILDDDGDVKEFTNHHTWEQFSTGFHVHVGDFHGFPVNLSIRWFRIDGVLVMFYEDISRVVDHDMVEKWLEKNCSPKPFHGCGSTHTNAMNFHLAMHYIRDFNVAQRKAV